MIDQPVELTTVFLDQLIEGMRITSPCSRVEIKIRIGDFGPDIFIIKNGELNGRVTTFYDLSKLTTPLSDTRPAARLEI